MTTLPGPDPERERLRAIREDRGGAWRRWGPYLSDRQWGTVREDYSPDGNAWTYLPHDHARSWAYRWGEDGLLGISDENGRLCFAIALWNERDPILKERLFGLAGPEGNHGEDVKEVYVYLDGTPTASYLRGLYRYPQAAFPYADLVAENGRRGRADPEYELADTGVLDDRRFFDVIVEYAKAAPQDIVVRIAVTNRGPVAAPIHLLPTLWFRNTWAWATGRRARRSSRRRQAAAVRRRRSCEPTTTGSGRGGCRRPASPSSSSRRTRRTPSGCSARPRGRPPSRTPSTTRSFAAIAPVSRPIPAPA